MFGGICGKSDGVSIKNCYNKNTTVTSNKSAGGIVGYTSSPVYKCYNTGKITAEDEAGGIAGNGDNKATDSNYYGSVHIEYCYNTGSIYTSENAGESGGIVGDVAGTSNYNSYVTHCYNYGSVSSYNKPGGIIGTMGNYVSVSNTRNDGTITRRNTGSATAYASGGIVGYTGALHPTSTSSSYSSSISYSTYRSGSAEYTVGGAANARKYGSNSTTSSYYTKEAILSLINNENAYVADTQNINGGYPILAWQVK